MLFSCGRRVGWRCFRSLIIRVLIGGIRIMTSVVVVSLVIGIVSSSWRLIDMVSVWISHILIVEFLIMWILKRWFLK